MKKFKHSKNRTIKKIKQKFQFIPLKFIPNKLPNRKLVNKISNFPLIPNFGWDHLRFNFLLSRNLTFFMKNMSQRFLFALKTPILFPKLHFGKPVFPSQNFVLGQLCLMTK